MKQEFIVIIAGMPRAATTFLYYKLADHPQIFVPSRKELEYFSLNYSRGLDWYFSFFSNIHSKNIGFDISPMYFFSQNTCERIVEFSKNQKLILIVRNPPDFSVSFFKNRLASSRIDSSFNNFLSGFQYEKDGRSLQIDLGPGVIEDQIQRFRNTFRDNVLLIDYRSIQHDPLEALRAIEVFVGARPYFAPGNFSNTTINASNQLRIGFVNRLMHQRWFSDMVTTVFPKRMIMAVRHRAQTSQRSHRPILDAQVEQDALETARGHFARDTRFVESLFENGPLVLGSGRPFRPAANAGGEGTLP